MFNDRLVVSLTVLCAVITSSTGFAIGQDKPPKGCSCSYASSSYDSVSCAYTGCSVGANDCQSGGSASFCYVPGHGSSIEGCSCPGYKHTNGYGYGNTNGNDNNNHGAYTSQVKLVRQELIGSN